MSSSQRPRIVVLDAHTLNPGDLSWSRLRSLGRVELYEQSEGKEIVDRSRDADILLVNKVVIDREAIEQLPKLQFICVTATGYNNVDEVAAAERNIPVSNAVGYSAESVAQHTFALLLELTNHVGLHNRSVKRSDWSKQTHFSYHLQPMVELAGKTMGIYGFGSIGQQVGAIANAFGMEVIAKHKHPERDARPWVRFVDIDTLFSKSDVVTLHAPLTEENAQFVDAERLKTMNREAFLINTARGGLINEADLKQALKEGVLAGAALDVLSEEPPPADHPLFEVENCLITPHQAWATKEARERLMDISVENVKAFLKGEPQNVVNAEDLEA